VSGAVTRLSASGTHCRFRKLASALSHSTSKTEKNAWSLLRILDQRVLAFDMENLLVTPLITTMARDGGYTKAMATIDDMTAFAGSLVREMGNAAKMDW
jgi:hypothetical protein